MGSAMSVIGKGKSALKLNKFSMFITSAPVIAVASAIILTPIFTRYLLPIIANLPYLKAHPTLALIAVALVLFIIAGMIGSGTLKVIFLGAAAGALINAFISSSTGTSIIGRLNIPVKGGA